MAKTPKTVKVLDMNDHGIWCEVIHTLDDGSYRLYSCYWDMGKHRKLIAKFANMTDALARIWQITKTREENANG